ncbi:MAG TPA: hypothetical protein VFB43_01675 [Terracidiphilus sp.]|jgi:hypothetical protein|nr:hypothetical protein [Terracidiphilus sp.]
MGSMKKWMLAAALAAGTVGLGASQAQAARIGIGVYVGGPSVYVPPCPGPGYAWVAGYYSNGYWVPGYWRAPVYVGGGYGYWHRPDYDHDRDRDYYHRDRDDRHWDRDDRHWDHDGDHFRR